MKMTKTSFFNVLDKNIKQHLTNFELVGIKHDEFIRNGIVILLKIKCQASLSSSHINIRVLLMGERMYTLFEDLAPECVLAIPDLQQLIAFSTAIKKELVEDFADA